MTNVFDVPNIVRLQQQLIQDLSGNDTLMNTLSSRLGLLDASASSSIATIIPTLTKQEQVNTVLEREKTRLEERKAAIDSADAGQRRLVDLTRNATQRNRAINNMYMVGVAALIVYLGIRFTAGMIPTLITDILMILLVSITILSLITMYYDYDRRNNMDFDMIDLGEPSRMVGKTAGAAGTGSAGSGAGIIESRIGGGCVKDACCPAGTTYNEKYAICVPKEPPYSVVNNAQDNNNKNPELYGYFMPGNEWKLTSSCEGGTSYDPKELACVAPKSGFTTMTSTSDKAKPNEPFEFSDYNLYK